MYNPFKSREYLETYLAQVGVKFIPSFVGFSDHFLDGHDSKQCAASIYFSEKREELLSQIEQSFANV